jgi:hypothetical protein
LRKHWNNLSAPVLLLAVFAALVPGSVAQQARITQPIQGSKVSPLLGTVAPQAKSEYDQGPVGVSTPLQGMSIRFTLSAAQQASLTTLLKAQQEPSSSSYHQWLTQAQFADQFGMSQADIAKVTEWLQAQGFTIDHVAESRNSIRFSGTVGQAEQAFHTQIHKYVVNGETHFANATEVSVPAALAGSVSRVGGLHNFNPKPRLVRAGRTQGDGAQPKFTSGQTGSHFVTPGDFSVLYDLKPLYTANFSGTGQYIGIAGQTDIVMADITSFRSAAGLPVNNPTVFLIPGSADPGIGDASGDINEADLDLELSGGAAANATIVFLNSTAVFDSLNYAIENKVNGVQIPILSVSYGNCEPNWSSAEITSQEASFQQANAQGQTILAAAGDDGAADCDEGTASTPITSATHGLQVDYPGSSASVTAMGGSEFMGDGTAQNPSTGADQYWNGASGSADLVTSVKSYIPEMVWNDTTISITNGGGLDGGGGGKSLLFPKPTWQTGVAGIPADSARDTPDLSLNASDYHDPYLVCTQIILDSDPTQSVYSSSCANGFRISDPGYQDDQTLTAFGGTSAAAPSMAGILALIEQKLGAQGLGNINPALYALASNATTYASAFHDITTGNNIVPCTAASTNCPTSGTAQIGYSAGTGFDQASGLGSVDANNLATAFTTVAVKAGTTTTIAVSPAAPVAGAVITLTATVKPSSGTAEPTGTVTFTIDGVAGTPVTVANGVAVTTTSFATGGAHTVVAAYSGDTNFFISSSGITTVNVAASGVAMTTTTLVASPTSIELYGAITLTATIKSSSGGTVAGTVTFTAGTTTVGTANITPGASGVGTATLAVTSATPTLGFTAGTDTITAAYGGDSTYAASSGTTTVTVTNPNITLTATNMTISSPNPGNSGTSTITVSSTGGYTGTVNLTATTSTLNASGGFGSSSLAVSQTTPGTTTFTVTTIAASGSERQSPGGKLRQLTAKAGVAGGLAAGCILLLLIPGIRRKRWPVAMIMLVFLGVGAGLGCGSGGSGGAAPAGTYTVTISAADTSNSAITATTTLTVTIQ